MRYKVTKEYEGKVEVRNYDVEKCIKNKEKMEIEFEGEIMTLTPEELSTKLKSVSKTFPTKNKLGKNYKLFGYVWNLDKTEI